MERIAICAVFHDEARYLLQWIGYHRMVGIDHFVLYDNASTDGGAALIRGSPLARHVTLIDWPMQDGPACAHGDFIQRHALHFAWAAFIDVNEYLHPLEAETIRPLLSRYDGFSGVLPHRLVFGSSVQAPAQGLAIANHVYRLADSAPPNQQVKSLLRTRDLLGVGADPQVVITRGPLCNTRGMPVPAQALHDPPCHEAIALNHYGVGPISAAQVEDRRMLRFVPRLAWVMRDIKAAPMADPVA